MFTSPCLFLGKSATNGVLRPDWRHSFSFRADGVYVRTARDVYETGLRSLENVIGREPLEDFIPVHQSVLVNANKVREFDATGRVKMIGLPVLGPDGKWLLEWMSVSRRGFRPIRSRFEPPGRLPEADGERPNAGE